MRIHDNFIANFCDRKTRMLPYSLSNAIQNCYSGAIMLLAMSRPHCVGLALVPRKTGPSQNSTRCILAHLKKKLPFWRLEEPTEHQFKSWQDALMKELRAIETSPKILDEEYAKLNLTNDIESTGSYYAMPMVLHPDGNNTVLGEFVGGSSYRYQLYEHTLKVHLKAQTFEETTDGFKVFEGSDGNHPPSIASAKHFSEKVKAEQIIIQPLIAIYA